MLSFFSSSFILAVLGVTIFGSPAAIASWNPQTIRVACAVGECPPAVGALVFAITLPNGSFELQQCTAFLVANDRVMSNGHCDFSDRGEGYFIPRADLGVPPVKISRVVFSTPRKSGTAVAQPDAAVFELQNSLPIKPLDLARGPLNDSFSELEAFVINPATEKNPDTLTIDKMTCISHRHEEIFPYDLRENPDLVKSFNCLARRGNSGAPMFAKGDRFVVQAIHQDVGPSRSRFVVGTNTRCLGYPDKPTNLCTSVTPKETARRFEALQTGMFETIQSRPASTNTDGLGPAPLELRFRTFANPLIARPGRDEFRYEVLYFPVCRLADEPLQAPVFPTEVVRITYDEWQNPRFERERINPNLGMLTAPAFERRIYSVQVRWPEAPGVFLRPADDPRVQFPKGFSVALPVCPR